MKAAVAVALVLAVAGCSAQEQFSRACKGAGFVPGTDQFANCMLYQQALDQQRAQIMIGGLAAAGAIQAASQPQMIYVHQAPQTCRFMGGAMYCQ